MSVLANHRTTSKAQFITDAISLQVNVLEFLSKLSNRYGRLLAPHIVELTQRIVSNLESANKVFPDSPDKLRFRNLRFSSALGHLSALDVQLTICYDVLMQNPQGAFRDGSNRSVPASVAIERLDNLCVTVGTLMDSLETEIKGVIVADKAGKSVKAQQQSEPTQSVQNTHITSNNSAKPVSGVNLTSLPEY